MIDMLNGTFAWFIVFRKKVFLRIENVVMNNLSSVRHTFLLITIALTVPFSCCWAQREGQKELLDRAYWEKSVEKLQQFFENWADEIPQNEAEVTNDTIAEAYRVFKAFYHPMQLDVITGSDFVAMDTALFMNKPYFIVQGSLREVRVADEIPYTRAERDSFLMHRAREYKLEHPWVNLEEVLRDTFEYGPRYEYPSFPPFEYVPSRRIDSAIRFCPDVRFDGKKVVYLTPEYRVLLDDFMDKPDNSRDPNKLRELMPDYNGKLRSEFLSWMALVRRRNMLSWDYQTGPWVYGIILDAQLQRAVVLYYYRFGGYQTTLLKELGEWRVAKVVSTWIE